MNDIVETISYRGHSIDVLIDDGAPNPFREFDNEPPCVVCSGRDWFTEYGLDLAPPVFCREQIKTALPALKRALGIKGPLLAFCREYAPSALIYYDNAEDLFNDALGEYVAQLRNSEKLEALSDLYRAAGVPAIHTSACGFSQGDYLEFLFVATPEYCEKIGTVPTEESLEKSAELYASWAFGNCYGYSVDAIEESCWGFYGDDHKESGLLEYAQNAIDCHIEHARRERLQRVKAWIKNRVPLIYRGAHA